MSVLETHFENKLDGFGDKRVGLEDLEPTRENPEKNRNHDFDAHIEHWEIVPGTAVECLGHDG